MDSSGKALRRAIAAASIATIAAVLCADGALAQDAAKDFKKYCLSCHTIGGGRLTGPDLQNVEDRKDRAWLTRFIVDPQGVLNSGDAYAIRLKEEANGAVMTPVAGMTAERAEALLDLIATESKLEKSQFAGVQVSGRQLTDTDVEQGELIFLGRKPLKNGGPACLSCHRTSRVPLLGGGRLAGEKQDLTKVFETLQGRRGLTAWLSAPATPMMQAVFEDHPLEGEEILALTAWFQKIARDDQKVQSSSTLLFTLFGFAGTVGVLFLMGRIWNRRFRTVRETLLKSSKVRESV